MGQWEALISHWLGQEPSNAMDAFAEQVAKAEWLERRHFENMQRMVGGVR